MAENTTPANSPEAEQDLSELLQIRRDKLTALQQEGSDPFEVTVSRQRHARAGNPRQF